MSAIDPDIAASRLCADTEKIAACIDHPDPASDLVAVIKWVRGMSRCASEELRAALIEEYSTVGWVAKEEGPEAIEGSYWIHGAIDGAYCFPQGLPLCSNSLTSVNGRAMLGPIHDPFPRAPFRLHMNCELAATSDAVLFRSLRSAMHSRNAEPF